MVSHPQEKEDSFDNMMRHMSKNDTLVNNLEQVSQMNSAQCHPVVVKMAAELSKELQKAKERRAVEKVSAYIALGIMIILGVVFLYYSL